MRRHRFSPNSNLIRFTAITEYKKQESLNRAGGRGSGWDFTNKTGVYFQCETKSKLEFFQPRNEVIDVKVNDVHHVT